MTPAITQCQVLRPEGLDKLYDDEMPGGQSIGVGDMAVADERREYLGFVTFVYIQIDLYSLFPDNYMYLFYRLLDVYWYM